MADTKITALNALVAVDSADVLAIVDDPAGAPETKKVTADDLVYGQAAVGGVHTNDGVGTQTLTLQNTWYQITQLDSDCACAKNITPDAANNRVRFDVEGMYTVQWQVSFTGSNSTVYEIQARYGAVQLVNTTAARKIGTGSDVGSFSAFGNVDVAAVPAFLTLWVRCTSGASKVLNVKQAQLITNKSAST